MEVYPSSSITPSNIHLHISINNDFEVIGLEIHSKIKFRIVSAYISPTVDFSYSNLQNDFNGQ